MPEVPQVSVRAARRQDATSIGRIWAAAAPQLVRSAERARADMDEDATLGRRRYVGVVEDVVVGTATVRRTGADAAFLSVEVQPDSGSRGVGTALIAAALTAFPEVTDLMAVCSEDPIALAFAVRNGFLPDGEGRLAHIDPASVPTAGRVPDGLTATRLDLLSDLSAVVETHNLAARDDPSDLSQQYTLETFLADWWNNPDNAPELSWALLDESAQTPVVASFTSVQVDRARRRSWSAMTATHPSYRGRGLARWVKQRMLNSVARAGVTDAVTANDSTNAPMIAINDALGYRPAGRFVRVRRRIPR